MSANNRRKPPRPGRLLHIVLLVLAVLIIFEGRLLVSVFSKGGLEGHLTAQISELFTGRDTEASKKETETETETETGSAPAADGTAGLGAEVGLVGLDAAAADPAETESETGRTAQPESEIISSALVPEQAAAVDDSYFNDAIFIGDSRMEGFRVGSGLTKPTFLTGIGMTTENIFDTAFISTDYSDENILVFQALYNTSCKKFYVLLGTNELGTYDWEEFKENYRIVLGELQKLSPSAVIYVISVPYVEEEKVTTGDYVNNENIDKMNNILVQLCEENDCYYLNVAEALSSGHSLIPGASADGIHLNADYCRTWLDYMKTHYVIPDTADAETETETGVTETDENASQTESGSTENTEGGSL